MIIKFIKHLSLKHAFNYFNLQNALEFVIIYSKQFFDKDFKNK